MDVQRIDRYNVAVDNSAFANVCLGNNNIIVVGASIDDASKIIIARLQEENTRLLDEVAQLRSKLQIEKL